MVQPLRRFAAIVKSMIGVVDLLEVSADEDDVLPLVLPDEVDDAAVFVQAFGAELGHCAEDEDFGAGLDGEVLDGGAHAGGVSVVGIEDDIVAILLYELAAAVGGDIHFDRGLYRLVGDAEVFADGDGGEDVWQVVVTDEPGADDGDVGAGGDAQGEEGAWYAGGGRLIVIVVIVGSLLLRKHLLKFVVLHGGVGGPGAGSEELSGDVGVMGAVFYDMGDAAAHFAELFIVPHDECGAVVAAEEVEEFALAFFYAFGAAEAFEMGLADVGDDAMGGEGVFTITFDLLLVVGAHFDDGQLGVGADGEEGEGDADMVVEVALGGVGTKGGGEDGVDELFSGRFSIAASYGEEWYVELLSVMEGELLQGLQGVGDEDEPIVGSRTGAQDRGAQPVRRKGLLVDDGVGGAPFQGLDGELVAVEVGAFQGEEEVAGAQLAGIRLDGGVEEIDIIELFDRHATKIKKPPLRAASLWKYYAT